MANVEVDEKVEIAYAFGQVIRADGTREPIFQCVPLGAMAPSFYRRILARITKR